MFHHVVSNTNQFFSLICLVTASFSRFLQLEIQLRNKGSRPIIHLVDVNGSDVSGVTYTADHLNNVLEAHNMSIETQYYWALPKEFLGNKVEISCLFDQSVLLRKVFVAHIFNGLFTPAFSLC